MARHNWPTPERWGGPPDEMPDHIELPKRPPKPRPWELPPWNGDALQWSDDMYAIRRWPDLTLEEARKRAKRNEQNRESRRRRELRKCSPRSSKTAKLSRRLK